MKLTLHDDALCSETGDFVPDVWLSPAAMGGAAKAVCAYTFRGGSIDAEPPLTATQLRPAEVVAPIVSEHSLPPGRWRRGGSGSSAPSSD